MESLSQRTYTSTLHSVGKRPAGIKSKADKELVSINSSGKIGPGGPNTVPIQMLFCLKVCHARLSSSRIDADRTL